MKSVLVAASPAVGPVIVNVLGLDFPVLASALSVVSLLIARHIAPASARRLKLTQEIALTVLLAIILLLVVAGRFGGDAPMGEGMAVVWGIGLGFSGLLIVQLIAEKVQAIVGAVIDALSGTNGEK